MASTFWSVPEDNYCYHCSVCHDIFKDPVILLCSHSFCNACLQRWWREKGIKQCPLCKEIHSTDHLPCNLALKNVCEAFVLKRQKASKRKRISYGYGPADPCGLHDEELKLFCLECQQPVCLVCRESKEHNNHRFSPVDEAAQEHKEHVQNLLKPCYETLTVLHHLVKDTQTMELCSR